MIFTKVRKAVAIVLLFALLFSTFPMSALANDMDNPEETAVTDETATVETTTEPTDGCLETEQATGLEPESTGEDEQDLMWVINPETGALELVRGLHHRLIRSNTVTNKCGGIYARKGAGSVSFTYTRANNTTSTFSLNAAYDCRNKDPFRRQKYHITWASPCQEFFGKIHAIIALTAVRGFGIIGTTS